MNKPKAHHYVPQFYLRRFANDVGRIWLWDRDRDRSFTCLPRNVAFETNFYALNELAKHGHDPLTMERQFATLEGEVAEITEQWLAWLRAMKSSKRIPIPPSNRKLVSLFIALQFLRTADTRDTLARLARRNADDPELSREEKRRLHTGLLWEASVFQPFADRIRLASWVFGRNLTTTPFITSDNPVAFRTRDNAMWLKAGVIGSGTYVVFPLAPDIIMYCFPKEPPWKHVVRFDRSLSPVTFTDEMVRSENSSQVFMASRFVISRDNTFDEERQFAKTIGTDLYARKIRKAKP